MTQGTTRPESAKLLGRGEGRIKGTVGGRPLEYSNVYRTLQTELTKARLPHFSMYALRHTATSLLKSLGADLHEIKTILGHSQIALTSDTYTHLWTETLRADAERTDRALTGG